MFGLGIPELLVIMVIVFVLFGAGKLPEVGKALGKGIRSFKKEMNSLEDELKTEPEPKSVAPKKVALKKAVAKKPSDKKKPPVKKK